MKKGDLYNQDPLSLFIYTGGFIPFGKPNTR